MFKFETIHENGDATCNYDIILDRPYTVREFIDAVLSRDREWGDIHVKTGKSDFIGTLILKYDRGHIKKCDIPDEFLSRKVKSVFANGGWGLMSYYITLRRRSRGQKCN